MIKRFSCLLLSYLLSITCVFAREIPVKIKPAHKISTSNLSLREGDTLEFIISQDVYINSKTYLKSGQLVQADITSLEDNGFLVQPAKIYIENFRTVNPQNKMVKLKGLIYKQGNIHPIVTEFFVFDVLRGGEVHLLPQKDEFTIYAEENL